jgi:AAA ATPase domain
MNVWVRADMRQPGRLAGGMPTARHAEPRGMPSHRGAAPAPSRTPLRKATPRFQTEPWLCAEGSGNGVRHIAAPSSLAVHSRTLKARSTCTKPGLIRVPKLSPPLDQPTIRYNIFLESFRCFVRPQWIPLAPLTILVGENSSGKSAFLAATSIALGEPGFPVGPEFNRAPYNLGTFEKIATFKGAGSGPASTFAIGHSTRKGASGIARYGDEHGNAVIRNFFAEAAEGSLDADFVTGTARISRQIREEGSNDAAEVLGTFDAAEARRHPNLLRYYFRSPFGDTRRMSETQKEFALIADRILFRSVRRHQRVVSLAPVRSKPRRTYDEMSETDSPEGEHVPFVIAKLLKKERSSHDSKSVRRALQRFGLESGLYREIGIRTYGKSLSEPFQIEVKLIGAPANLIDVGYGVSQSLPIIVQSSLASAGQIVLMQQPEVHLHPRAQAALGSFFVDMVAKSSRTFVIETHSDYLLDRIRQEVAANRIEADKVLVLFFDKPRRETTVYPIRLDAQGNVLDVPPSYREFFFQEELNLLNRTKS